MYAQAAIKPNTLLRNGAYGIVMRGVQKCTCAGALLRGRNSAPLCCIKLDTATDPAMGTAGFLVEAAKYIQHHQQDDLMNIDNNRMFNNETFYGCDNDSNMSRIGYMNCILHNIKNPIITVDSLLEHDNARDYFDIFDLVLQNPPFAGSLVESAINGKILGITKTKKTELLFVSLMLMLMKVGGRGMSIVPDGVLFGSENAYISLRKELVDKQKLIGVISMPVGIFMASTKKGSASKGAGVKTSFLIFQKTNNGGTDNVWFYDMKNDGFTLDVKRSPVEGSNIPEIIERYNNLDKEMSRTRKDQSFMVPVEEIRKNNYDLTFNKYRKVECIAKSYRPTDIIFSEIEHSVSQEKEILNEIKKCLM